MPTRKEPKEAVTYPASKRKPIPFKPHRPSKLVRTSAEDSSTSGTTRGRSDPGETAHQDAARPSNETQPSVPPDRAASIISEDFEMSELDEASNSSSDDLPDDPLKAVATTRRRPSAGRIANQTMADQIEYQAEQALLPETFEADIPQALLLRLMHEHFESKDTRIDKQAIKVLQRYVEIFLRESVARAALSQKAEVDAGAASQSDRGWLDKKDLEKVAGGIILDF